MLVNLLVNCQYFENYNVGLDGFNTYGDGKPHWKPKGGYTFKMPVDSDTIFYAESEVVESAIKKLLENHNSVASKFKYIDHEVQWEEPTIVEGLEETIQELHSEVVF